MVVFGRDRIHLGGFILSFGTGPWDLPTTSLDLAIVELVLFRSQRDASPDPSDDFFRSLSC